MGEAKRRGSFEERKSKSIENKKLLLAELNERRTIAEANRTPEEKKKRHSVRTLLATASTLAATSTYGSFGK